MCKRFVPIDWDLTSIVPPNISPDEAASIPIPFLTAVQCLYLRLGLPEPPAKVNGGWILIWSGVWLFKIFLLLKYCADTEAHQFNMILRTFQNTSVGRFAIQLAKLSGLKVATTASRNFDRLKAIGADLVLDYKVSE